MDLVAIMLSSEVSTIYWTQVKSGLIQRARLCVLVTAGKDFEVDEDR